MRKPTESPRASDDVAPCRIIEDPVEVAARLRELRIPEDTLREVRNAWARGEASVGPFAPKNGAGTESWMRAIETMRELLHMDRWTLVDARGIAPYIQSPDGEVALTVASGDHATGLSHLTPITKNIKGIVVAEAVGRNGEQLGLDFGTGYRAEVKPRPHIITARVTMILLMNTVYHRRPNEPVTTDYRAEISTPRAMAKRRVTAWYERIILAADSDRGSPNVRQAPIAPPELGKSAEINIQVPRKKGA